MCLTPFKRRACVPPHNAVSAARVLLSRPSSFSSSFLALFTPSSFPSFVSAFKAHGTAQQSRQPQPYDAPQVTMTVGIDNNATSYQISLIYDQSLIGASTESCILLHYWGFRDCTETAEEGSEHIGRTGRLTDLVVRLSRAISQRPLRGDSPVRGMSPWPASGEAG